VAGADSSWTTSMNLESGTRVESQTAAGSLMTCQFQVASSAVAQTGRPENCRRSLTSFLPPAIPILVLVEFSDYRETSGVQIPYSIKRSQRHPPCLQSRIWWGGRPLAYRNSDGSIYFQQLNWEGTQRVLTNYAGSMGRLPYLNSVSRSPRRGGSTFR
jgi:hypothetical protein